MSDHDETRSQEASSGDARAQDAASHTTRTVTEEFRVSGERVLAEIKELVRQGNVRRITIKNDEGRTLIEIPLTVGVIGTLLLPVWAAIGAIAALAANLTLSVERREPAPAAGATQEPRAQEPQANGTA